MKAIKEIPQEVIEAAKELGNTIDYEGIFEGKLTYSVGNVSASGEVLPTGMPIFILYDGNTTEIIIGEKSFDIISQLNLS